MDDYTERYGNRLDKQYFNFAAAHFLIFADGTREPLHGHNYRAELEFETAGLDDADLVADFIEVKPLFKKACDGFDHRVLLPTNNPGLSVERHGARVVARWRDAEFVFPAEDVVLLDVANTSSELLARSLCERFQELLSASMPELELQRVSVCLSESPGQSARYERVRRPSVASSVWAAHTMRICS